MANSLMRSVRALLPNSAHDWREAGALTWLAGAASSKTGLAWLGHKALIGLVRCGKNAIGPALERLETAGRLSIYRRPGRAPVYLVHPDGLETIAPMPADAIRAHLKLGHFGQGDTEGVLEWLASLGVLAAQGSIGNFASARHKARKGVPAVGTPVETSATRAKASRRGGQGCPSHRDGCVPTGGTEPIDNPNITQSAETLPNIAQPLPSASRKSKRAEWPIWRGQPDEVLAALIAAGGKTGRDFAAMTTEAALAQVERQQRILGFGPQSRAA
jgi:hypothetical protein